MREMLDVYRSVTAMLPPSARRFLVWYAVALSALAVLDAASLSLLALVTAPIVTGSPARLPLVGEVEGIGLIIALGFACLLVIVKSVAAVWLLWSATRKMANYDQGLSVRLFRAYLEAPWTLRLRRNSAHLVRTSEGSVSATIGAFLLPGASMLGEAATFVVVITVLFIANPVLAVVTLVYLLGIGAIMFFWITRRAKLAGRVAHRYALRNARLVTEMIAAFKEITLRGKVDEVAELIKDNRGHTARARSNARFLGLVPRYILDAGIIGGVILAGGIGALTGGVTGAATAVALFGLAGFRIAPSIVRVQGGVATMLTNIPHAKTVVHEIMTTEAQRVEIIERPSLELPEEPAELRFENVSFRYLEDAPDAIHDLSFTVPLGSSVAFVGSSGAGKSTIVDLALGLIEPTAGRITIDGTDLRDATASWQARLGYVPQEVVLFDATVAQNVALTWGADYDPERVRASLAKAQILDLIEARDGGIEAPVGERGVSLSGGQRQRLGIARALYSSPLVLVMDEATSALDTATEAAVIDSIRSLHGQVTTITVAHRLSTIRNADRIHYMEHGRLVAFGTFDELVAAVPAFAAQATLAGLIDPGKG